MDLYPAFLSMSLNLEVAVVLAEPVLLLESLVVLFSKADLVHWNIFIYQYTLSRLTTKKLNG